MSKDQKTDDSMPCNLDPAKAKESECSHPRARNESRPELTSVSFVVGAEQDWKDDPIEPPKGKSFGPGLKHSHASYYAEITGDMEGWATHNYIMFARQPL